jgi:deazaflavin-dependent oxidoreductase (nitroreductase family)
MDTTIEQALKADRVVDITTLGRKTGVPRRIEIWFHNIDEKLYITGIPGPRSWYANVKANPDFTFHLKHSTQVDIPATATPILDEAQRQDIIGKILKNIASDIDGENNLDTWVERSPLIEITLNQS